MLDLRGRARAPNDRHLGLSRAAAVRRTTVGGPGSGTGGTIPGALHVRLLNRGGAGDPDVWELAREHGCVLVTKDGDFHRLSLLRGAPPKIVWLRIGNCSTADITRLLIAHAEDIRKFEAQSDATVLELG